VPPAWLSANDPEDQELAFDERETVVVEPTRGREFADAIADPNPLYRDGAAAHIAGLPDVIVPALYPVTRLHDALQQRRSGAARVARLAVRLVTPVLPGDELRLGFSPGEGDRLRVAVQNQRGEPVLACGLAELRR
jgi:acyl dehydratase